MASKTTIPVCPLMSAGNEIPVVCVQEKCAWYIESLKICSIYMIGHNARINSKAKLERK